jgi:hypothetical protein
LICPSRVSCTTNSGIISTDGIFFDSTRHSSRRRAASMSRFVLLFEIVLISLGAAGSNLKSPWFQMASAYTASSPDTSSRVAWTMRPSWR